jgi:hypothetical protein
MPRIKREGDKKHGDELESLIERTGDSSREERGDNLVDDPEAAEDDDTDA